MVKNYISSALLKGMAVASLVFGLGSGAAVAQSYTENFNTPSSIFTAGWAQVNRSNPVGTSAWFTGNPSAFVAYNGADSTYIGSNYNAVNNAGTISNCSSLPRVPTTMVTRSPFGPAPLQVPTQTVCRFV